MAKPRLSLFSSDERNVIEEALLHLDLSKDDFLEGAELRKFKKVQKQLLKEFRNLSEMRL